MRPQSPLVIRTRRPALYANIQVHHFSSQRPHDDGFSQIQMGPLLMGFFGGLFVRECGAPITVLHAALQWNITHLKKRQTLILVQKEFTFTLLKMWPCVPDHH